MCLFWLILNYSITKLKCDGPSLQLPILTSAQAQSMGPSRLSPKQIPCSNPVANAKAVLGPGKAHTLRNPPPLVRPFLPPNPSFHQLKRIRNYQFQIRVYNFST